MKKRKKDYTGLIQRKRAVQNLVKSQATEAESTVERYGDVIYLIPKEENVFLGFSKAKLKETLCKSAATDKDFYLSQFVILTLLVEFYDGQEAAAGQESISGRGIAELYLCQA